MKLERLPEYFVTFIIILVALLFAVFIGAQAGSGGIHTVVIVVGAVCFLMIGAIMGRHVWLLIPLSLYGNVKILNLPITMAEAGIITAFGWWVIFAAFKRVPMWTRFRWIDCMVVLNVSILVMMFARNPVGGMVLESEMIGGRPYFGAIFGLMGYWVLSRVKLDELWARRLPWLVAIGSLPVLGCSLLVRIVPGGAPLTIFLFGIDAPSAPQGGAVTAGESDEQRASFLIGPTQAILTSLFAYYRTSSFLNPLYFWRVSALAIGSALILLGGFRNAVANLVIIFLVIAWYRRQLSGVVKSALVAVPVAIILLAGHGTLYKFPYSVQRSLSFLPANWDEAPVKSANASTEWRFTLWEMLLRDDRYLKNHWLGDGFGYSSRAHQQLGYQKQQSSFAVLEYFLLVGQVHGGPFSAIRFAGYLGLVCFYMLVITIAVQAHRMIKRAMGTPFEMVALVLGVPMVIMPFFFTFVFGTYEGGIVTAFVRVGLLKMLQSALEVYLKRTRKEKEEEERLAALPPATAEESPAIPALTS